MSPSSLKPRLYYGWLIVFVSFLTLAVAFGIRLSFTVLFVALIDEFNWPHADTALIFSTTMIVFALTSTPSGMALDRWGARKTFGAGIVLMAIGLLLSSQIQTLGQLIFTYGIIVGLGITILGLGPHASLIGRWFRKRRGLATGITFAGTGVGTLFLTPAAEFLVGAVGWRTTYIIMAGLVLLVLPPVVLHLRLNPEDKGLRIDGVSEAEHQTAPLRENWTMARALKSPAFWLVILASLGATGPLRMLTVHQLAIMYAAGVNRLFAASMVGFGGIITALSAIGSGHLSDRIGRRKAYALGSICLLAATILLWSTPFGVHSVRVVVYVLMLGLGEGARAALITAITSDLFPGSAVGGINGAVGAAFGAGAALFPWLAGRMFDLQGEYTIAFVLSILAIIVSAAALWLAPVAVERPRRKDRSLKEDRNSD